LKFGAWIFTYSEVSDVVKFRSIFSDSPASLKRKQEDVVTELIGDEANSFWSSYPTNRGSFQNASADFRNQVMCYKERSPRYAI